MLRPRRLKRCAYSSAQRSTGRRIFEAALAGGAQALGAESPLLQEGGAADIVSLDPEHPALWCQRADGVLDGWIFTARDRAIDCVWRAGTKVVAGGRHIAREAIERGYRRTLERLLG